MTATVWKLSTSEHSYQTRTHVHTHRNTQNLLYISEHISFLNFLCVTFSSHLCVYTCKMTMMNTQLSSTAPPCDQLVPLERELAGDHPENRQSYHEKKTTSTLAVKKKSGSPSCCLVMRCTSCRQHQRVTDITGPEPPPHTSTTKR